MTRLKLTLRTLGDGVEALKAADPALGRWIEVVGPVGLRRQSHRFGCLCRAIISQQLAAGAALSIHRRFRKLFSPAPPEPRTLLRLELGKLRACGLSRPKAEYLRHLARAFADGPLGRLRLGALEDEEVIAALTELPGIGRWTAEMFLIFALGRPDVFALGDAALKAGVERVEGRPLDRDEVARVAERWRPFRSVASLYLWRVVHWKGPYS